jgi:hypothetical protein
MRKKNEAWKLAQEQVRKAQKRQKPQTDDDKKATASQCEIGETVFLYMPGLKTWPNYKLARPFKGPYTVVASYPNGVKLVPVDKTKNDPYSSCPGSHQITNIGNSASHVGESLL